MITLTSFIVCIASPFLIKIPLFAPIPEPTVSAIGVAKPKAQGQDITKTAIAFPIAEFTPPPNTSHPINVNTDKVNIDGTKIFVILSANF